MNSKHIHILEKRVSTLFCLTFILYVCNIIFSSVVTYIAMLTSFFVLLYCIWNTHRIKGPFYQKGMNLSKELGLKYLLLVETDLLPNDQIMIYELHHLSPSVRNGFSNMKHSYKGVMNDYEQGLQKDFIKLAAWQKKEKVCIITTTHSRMKNVWQRNSSTLQFKQAKSILDPYAKMNVLQWITASFSLTGRLKLTKRPHDWHTYYVEHKKK